MPWITAVGLRWLMPFGSFPAGRIQARLAVTLQPNDFGIAGFKPTKIIPVTGGNTQGNWCGVSTHQECGNESWALWYGTGDQPAGVLDTSASGPSACRVLPVRAADDAAAVDQGDAS